MLSKQGVFAGMILIGAAQRLHPLEDPPGLETRAYDLGAIVGNVHNWPFILRPQGALILGERHADPKSWDGIPLFGDEEGDRAPRDASEKQDPQAPSEAPRFQASESRRIERQSLAEALMGQLSSQGVEVNGDAFAMSWSGSVLHVRASPAVHETLRALLAPLEEAASVLISTECLLIPQDVLDKLEPAWRTTSPSVGDDVFEKALAEPSSRLLSVISRNGQRSASGSKDLKSFVVDQEINQTGVIPVTNPVIDTPFAGDRLEVRASLIPGDEAIWLDLAVGRAETSAKPAHLGLEWGDLELTTIREMLLSASISAVPGKAIVAGSLDGDESPVVLVRARIRKAKAATLAAATPGERTSRVYDVSLLFQGRPARRWPSASAQDRFSQREPRFDSSVALGEFLGIETTLQGEVEVFNFDEMSHSIFLSGSKSAHEHVERLLKAERARLTQLAAIDVEILTVPRAILAQLRARSEDGFVLRPDWEKDLEGKDGVQRRKYSVTGVAGEVQALRRATIRSFVVGVSQVSGGTGFAIIERSDPEMSTCGEGIELRLQCSFPSGSGGARLQLEGGEAKILEERHVKASFPLISFTTATAQRGAQAGPGTGDVGQAPIVSEMREIELTLPRQAVEYWKTEMDVPLGRDVILWTSASPGDAATLLLGRVRQVR